MSLLLSAVDRPTVIKRYQRPPFPFKYLKYRILSLFGIAVPIEFKPARQRRDFEHDTLILWRALGYPVPRVYDSPRFSNLEQPALALEYIEGMTLKEYFNDKSISRDLKINLFNTIIKESRTRHEICLQSGDFRLIKYDSNLGNYIAGKNGVYFIDFEAGRAKGPLLASITHEITKLTLQSIAALGPSSIGEIASILVKEYAAMGVTGRMIDSGFSGRHPRIQRKRLAARIPFILAYALSRRTFTANWLAEGSKIERFAAAAATRNITTASNLAFGRHFPVAKAAGAVLHTLIVRRGIRFGIRGLKVAAFNCRFVYRSSSYGMFKNKFRRSQ